MLPLPNGWAGPTFGTEVNETTATRPEEASERSSLARSGLIAFAGSVVNGLAAFLVIVAITNVLDDKASSGLVFTAIALFNIAFAVAALGADVGLVRFTAQNRSSALTLFKTAAVPALISSCSMAGAISPGLRFHRQRAWRKCS